VAGSSRSRSPANRSKTALLSTPTSRSRASMKGTTSVTTGIRLTGEVRTCGG
jgi:hypothetical protein